MKPVCFLIAAFCIGAQSPVSPAYLSAASRFPAKPVALIHSPTAPACGDLMKTVRQLAGFGLPAVLLHPQPDSPCPALPSARVQLPTDAAPAAWTLVLLAPDRRTRFIRRFKNTQDLAQTALDWDAGRQSFSAHCGHCHGDDGADTSYASIKSLAGVSARLSRAKIIEGGQNFGAVDLSSWSARDLDRLLLFVSGP